MRTALCESPLQGTRGVLKRVTDIVFSALLLVVAAPVMILIAIAIKLDSPGRVFFKQDRYGLDGERIVVYKFRTMSVCENGGVIVQAKPNDSRVTRVGRILRRTSLDELPNLVNVLRGDMALVGPRPTIPAHLDYFHPHQHRRHAVRPGITGWAQVNGRVGITWGERIELDDWYVEHRSPRLDLRILARTVAHVVSGRGLDPG